MKLNIKNIGIAIAVTGFLASCELTETLENGKITQGSVSSEDGGCSAFDSTAITDNGSLIVTIGSEYQQGDVLWRGATSVASDEVMIPTQGSDWFNDGKFVAYHTHNFVASDRDLTNTFSNLGTNIFNAGRNEGVFRSRGENQLAAQAIVIGAYTKWMMLDNFGVIQLQNLNPCNLNEDPDFLTGSEAVNNILQSLETDFVFDNLPANDYGNPTLATAYALLARIYINKFIYDGTSANGADMNKVIEYADLVAQEGFRLSDVNQGEEWFTTNFGVTNENSPENIWVLANERGASVGGISGGLTRPQMAWNQGGWNGMAVVADFYNSFDSNDPRFSSPGTDQMNGDGNPDAPNLNFGMLVGQQTTNGGANMTDRVGNPLNFTVDVGSIRAAAEYEGPRMIKFEPDQTNTVTTANDFPLLRFADIHLMKAEALWRNGNSSEAIALINDLRASRGYTTQLTSIGSEGREILDERGFELYNEMIRRTDQIRFGSFQDAWAHKPAEASNASNLFPVPSDFVALFPTLEQNPGF